MPKLGHFAFDKKIIARGFTSVVYKGIDEITNKKVAIKCIDEAILDEPGKKKMLANELSIQWQLKQQPYVVEIKGQFYQNDCIYIVSEYCQSGDLKNKIKEKGKFVEAKAVSYMTDIIKGFQTLYRHNIVHRDLKPSNIMISKKGIKIGDFGFAYKVVSNQNADEINLPSAGSPLYMAPQVLENGENSSYQSDIWSLGVVFFEMLTGRLPFPAKNKQTLIKLIDKIVIRTIIPQNISPRSKQFLLRTLKKDPQKRMTPQQLINYQFDQQILFNIQLHRQRKLQQQYKHRQQREYSTSSEDRYGGDGSQQKQSLQGQQRHHHQRLDSQYNHSHLHHHNPQVEKKHQHHGTNSNNNYSNNSNNNNHHHLSGKDFQPQKPPHTSYQHSTVPEELIVKKHTYKVLEVVGQTNNINTNSINNKNSNSSTNNINKTQQFDNNTHTKRNLLDPHDIKMDRFKRKSADKNDDVHVNTNNGGNNNNGNGEVNNNVIRKRQQIEIVLNRGVKKYQIQGINSNSNNNNNPIINSSDNNKQSLAEQMKSYQPNSYIIHKRPITKRSSQIVGTANNTNNNYSNRNNINENQQQLKHTTLKSHQSMNSTSTKCIQQDNFSKQPTIHSASQLQQSRRVNHHYKLKRQDSKSSQLSQYNGSDNNHQHNHKTNYSHSPQQQQMKKQQIIQILLNQVDIIRFLSRIMHKIQQLHHIHTSERHQRSLSHHYANSGSRQARDHHLNTNNNQHNNHNQQQPPTTKQQPAIYIQLKQLIYKTIQQIQKLQFLPDQIAYKFFRSQQFDQIKIILDTYKSKLDLVGVKSLQWKGIRQLQKQLEKQILLIYSTIKEKITMIENKHLQTQQKEIKKLNRKIQALDHLIVFRYDYLILQRQQIFFNQTGHKNAHHHQKCSRIKQIIEERHSRTHDVSKTIIECYNQLRKIQNVMKKIKLI